jgi:hypothetical protein
VITVDQHDVLDAYIHNGHLEMKKGGVSKCRQLGFALTLEVRLIFNLAPGRIAINMVLHPFNHRMACIRVVRFAHGIAEVQPRFQAPIEYVINAAWDDDTSIITHTGMGMKYEDNCLYRILRRLFRPHRHR